MHITLDYTKEVLV